MLITYPSKIFEDAVNEFARLPGIGRKSALRMVLFMLKQDVSTVQHFSETIQRLRAEIKYCNHCHNISETEICSICADNKRDKNLLCIVENVRDVIAIENTQQYRGLYHVLGGIISPLDGIGPAQLNIQSLIDKATSGQIKEVVMALATTMEGDTTVFYLYKKLHPLGVSITTIARGVSVGGEIEYADEITLGRSILNRVAYENSITK
ncbi:MAG: recombination protein RecR [Bacteroidia bacterium]|nr:recombination protein RecR [Bacteroidia bacterium]